MSAHSRNWPGPEGIFHQMNVPKSWSDVTLSQFLELSAIPKDLPDTERSVQVMAALLDVSRAQVLKMTPAEHERISNELDFTRHRPKQAFERVIEVDGVRYGFVPDLSGLLLNEYMDLEEYSAHWAERLPDLMSVLYRRIVRDEPDGHYEIEEYDSSKAQRTAKVFERSMSYQDAYGASLFFSLIEAECSRCFPEFSASQSQLTTT